MVTQVRCRTSPLYLDDAPAPPPDTWEIQQTFTSTYWKDRYHQSIASEYRPTGLPSSTTLITKAWNGTFGFQLVDGDAGVSISGRATAADNHQFGFLFDLVAERFPAASHLTDFFPTATILQSTIDTDGKVTCSFHPENAPDVIFTIEASTRPVFRLKRILREIRRDGPTPFINRNDFFIDEWMEVDGLDLPKRATLYCSELGRARYERNWIRTVTRYERLSCNSLTEAPSDTLFEIQYAPGMGVYDERLNLSFTVGGTSLHLDGVAYVTTSPLLAHPGDQLAEVLRTARRIEPVARSPQATITPAPQVNSRAILIAILAALGAGLVLFAVLRMARHRKPGTSP
ncbi:MAG: hypothetical protein HRU76_10695 [Phycisphaeraceae bacterium]|nr:MAG: hypothetical protein HRU76_10695 [Phycisphaeraceae bacterium]